MRLMIVGSDKVYAIENFYVKYLREAGVDVHHFCAQTFFYDYYQRNLFNKLLFKAGLSSIIDSINKRFKESVTTFKPNIIWVFKGMELSPDSLRWASDRGIVLVNYNPDNPFLFTGKGSGNQYVTDSIDLYRLHFTYNLEIKQKLEQRGLQTSFLPFGYDIAEETLRACRKQDEVAGVCFLGNPDKQRAALLSEVAGEGVTIDVYGNNWNKFIQHDNVRVFQPVYGIEFWKVLYRYRVQLNFMRIHNEDSHNMRTFEVPGIGAIQLAPDTTEHRMFFAPDREIFLYSSAKGCSEQARFLLALSSEDAQALRQSALDKSCDAGYSYRDRALFSLEVMNKLLHD